MLAWRLLTLCGLPLLRLGSAAEMFFQDYVVIQATGAPVDPAVGRVLLFISAVIEAGTGSDHVSHLYHLWPVLLRKNRMLRSADILLYVGVYKNEFSELTVHTVTKCVHGFPNNSTRVFIVENIGYQEGAIDSMRDGVRNHWFDSYDWCSKYSPSERLIIVPRVIRLNPDAIIYDESRLKGLMAQPSLHGIFSNCLRVDCSHNFVLMTDFLVFRPREANYDKWFEEKINHAEEWCSSVFGDMARSDRAGWIQRISHHPSCRIAQEDIGHTHEKWTVKLDYIIDGRTSCPAANYDPCDPD